VPTFPLPQGFTNKNSISLLGSINLKMCFKIIPLTTKTTLMTGALVQNPQSNAIYYNIKDLLAI